MDGTIYVKPERIRQYVIDLFGYYHVSKADAGMIADNLIDAEIRSVTTHGLTRIPLYTEKLISGLCDARAVPGDRQRLRRDRAHRCTRRAWPGRSDEGHGACH